MFYRRAWICNTCDNPYETEEIEQLLVDSVNRKVMGYVLQDLQCSKCKEVSQNNCFLSIVPFMNILV